MLDLHIFEHGIQGHGARLDFFRHCCRCLQWYTINRSYEPLIFPKTKERPGTYNHTVSSSTDTLACACQPVAPAVARPMYSLRDSQCPIRTYLMQPSHTSILVHTILPSYDPRHTANATHKSILAVVYPAAFCSCDGINRGRFVSIRRELERCKPR